MSTNHHLVAGLPEQEITLMEQTTTLALALTFSLLIVSSAIAQQGKWGKKINQTGYCTQIVDNLPLEDVSDKERAGLIYMREEEKLARDLCQSFYHKWGTRIFDDIAQSEQKHTDSIRSLLVKYEIEDPVANDQRGIFTNTEIQQIYNELLISGSISFLDALQVGAAVEELDISDLTKIVAEADSQDIKIVYQNLMKGSRNHLRSYVSMLEAYGRSYEAVYLTSEEVTAIIDSPMENGLYDEDGNSMFE